MDEVLDKLGLHLYVMLYTAGADDRAFAEIIESLERAKKRAKETEAKAAESKDSQG